MSKQSLPRKPEMRKNSTVEISDILQVQEIIEPTAQLTPFRVGSQVDRKAVFSQKHASSPTSELNSEIRKRGKGLTLNEDLKLAAVMNSLDMIQNIEDFDNENIADEEHSKPVAMPHAIKLEPNSSTAALPTWDAKLAQAKIEQYNKEVRERHMKTFKKRQEKNQKMKRMRDIQKASGDIRDVSSVIDETESDENHDLFEAIQLKKINKKFSKLMSFDIGKSLNKTQDLVGKYQTTQNQINNLSAADNMRLN